MLHIGILCLPVPGHLHPMAALGRELGRRGHRVTLFNVPDIAAAARTEGLEFHPIGRTLLPLGSLPPMLARLGELQGLAARRYTTRAVVRSTMIICRDAPAALRAAGVDALLVDAVEPGGGTVADYLGLPFVTVCNALPLNEEADVPPIFTHWDVAGGPLGRLRNRAAGALGGAPSLQVAAVLWTYRRQWKLASQWSINQTFSSLAQISQLPAVFDFPRRALPPHFHYTGPFRRASSHPIPFPYERLDGRPLIYASLGTLQNRRLPLFQAIAGACADLDAQLVLSLGGGGLPEDLTSWQGNPLVVSYAPQPELIQRAALTITHAGLNTVLESLTFGVPMVALPITNDQPGVAARLRRSGAGEAVLPARAGTPLLRAAIRRVLEDGSYRARAHELRAAIQAAGGVGRAADIAEAAFASRRPVLTG